MKHTQKYHGWGMKLVKPIFSFWYNTMGMFKNTGMGNGIINNHSIGLTKNSQGNLILEVIT